MKQIPDWRCFKTSPPQSNGYIEVIYADGRHRQGNYTDGFFSYLWLVLGKPEQPVLRWRYAEKVKPELAEVTGYLSLR